MSAIHALRRLTARDFKRHKELIVDFSDSMTTIRGPNYTGKSSLLEALRFAFGGSSFVPGGRAIIVRTGAKDCSVELEFKASAGEYRLWRSLKDAKLTLLTAPDPTDDDGKLIATGHTAVNAAVESIIGMPLKDWLILSYSEQGEAAALMTLGASKLNQMIEQLSKVDFITKVSERAKTVADKSSASVKSFPEYLLDFDVDTAAISLAEMLSAYSALLEKRKVEENSLALTQKEHETITTQIGIARQAEKHRQELSQQCTAIEARLKQTEEALTKEKIALSVHDKDKDSLLQIPTFKEQATALKSKAAQANVANNQLVILTTTIQAKEAWVNGAGLDTLTRYREAAGPLADLTAEVNSLQLEYAGDQSTLAAMRQDWEKAEESVKAGVCRTCKRPMEGGNHEHAVEEAARLKKEYEDAVAVVNELHGRLAKSKTNLAALLQRMPSPDIQSIYPQRERELKEAKETLEHIKAQTVESTQIKAWEEEANTLSTRAAELSKIKWEIEHRNVAVGAYEESLAADRKLWVNAQDRLSEIKLVDTTELEDKRAQLAGVVNDVTKKVYDIRHEIADLEHKQSLLRARKAEFEEISASNAEHAARAASFSGLRRYLSDNKAVFMGELWDQLMALTSEFANQVTEGDITAVGRTEDGEFWMEEFGVRKPMIAASGGQKSICGVGLRMALPSLIPGGSRLILLDEPSAALTEEMSSSLAGALKAQDRQIVLVTHRSGEEYLSDVVVTLER